MSDDKKQLKVVDVWFISLHRLAFMMSTDSLYFKANNIQWFPWLGHNIFVGMNSVFSITGKSEIGIENFPF